MLNKRMVLLLFALIIVLVSGCVMNKTGWDQEKYEKYSEFYDKINNSNADGHKSGSVVEIEDFMIGMPQDTEFDKTWYFTLLYFKRGVEAKNDGRKEIEGLHYPRPVVMYKYVGGQAYKTDEYKTYLEELNRYKEREKQIIIQYKRESENYYNQSYEYRQKIEEMKPDDGKNG